MMPLRKALARYFHNDKIIQVHQVKINSAWGINFLVKSPDWLFAPIEFAETNTNFYFDQRPLLLTLFRPIVTVGALVSALVAFFIWLFVWRGTIAELIIVPIAYVLGLLPAILHAFTIHGVLHILVVKKSWIIKEEQNDRQTVITGVIPQNTNYSLIHQMSSAKRQTLPIVELFMSSLYNTSVYHTKADVPFRISFHNASQNSLPLGM